MENRFRVLDVAIAIVTLGRRVLIAQRRKDDSAGGLWEFPGGKVEREETIEGCLHRELREELGISVQLVHRFDAIDHAYPDVCVRLHPFLCALLDGDPRPLASQEVRWVTPDELRDFAFPAANEALIEQVIVRLSETRR